MYRFEKVQFFDAPLERVRGFFSDVRNLNSLTPPFFHLVLLEGETGIPLYQGQHFRYRFSMFAIPLTWVTEIESVTETLFIDIQKGGPYRSFRHTHYFYEVDTRTLMVDRVDYSLSFGPLSGLANLLVVRPLLEAIFSYRAARAPGLLLDPGDSKADGN